MSTTQPSNGHPAAVTAAFVHHPRPAHVSGEHPKQRRYGANEDAAFVGIYAQRHHSNVTLRRIGDEAQAELSVHITHMPAAAEALILLSAPALRELARCLIDAAHDIDGGEA